MQFSEARFLLAVSRPCPIFVGYLDRPLGEAQFQEFRRLGDRLHEKTGTLWGRAEHIWFVALAPRSVFLHRTGKGSRVVSDEVFALLLQALRAPAPGVWVRLDPPQTLAPGGEDVPTRILMLETLRAFLAERGALLSMLTRGRAAVHRPEIEAAGDRDRRQILARQLCRAVATGSFSWAEQLVALHAKTPEVFVELVCKDALSPPTTPLRLAAGGRAPLAHRMLDAGADPTRPHDTQLLYLALQGQGGEDLERQHLFARFLRLGLSPSRPLLREHEAAGPYAAPYSSSLLAYLVEQGPRWTPCIELLLAHPGCDGMVWPTEAGVPLAASEYAWLVGREETMPVFEAWGRWSGLRRAWVGAVVRACRK